MKGRLFPDECTRPTHTPCAALPARDQPARDQPGTADTVGPCHSVYSAPFTFYPPVCAVVAAYSLVVCACPSSLIRRVYVALLSGCVCLHGLCGTAGSAWGPPRRYRIIAYTVTEYRLSFQHFLYTLP